jgi:hypothetical protein
MAPTEWPSRRRQQSDADADPSHFRRVGSRTLGRRGDLDAEKFLSRGR